MSLKQLESLAEVEEQIAARIKDFNNKRFKLKKLNNALIIGQAIFSSLTTVLIAINASLEIQALAFIAIVVSALSSLAGVFLSKYMFQERLASQISTVCSLRELAAIISIRKKQSIDDEKYSIDVDDVQAYFDQYQSILDVANQEWRKLVISSKPLKSKTDR